MGTSGQYGGSPGWGGVRDDTEDWLSSENGPDSEENGNGDMEEPDGAGEEAPPAGEVEINPNLAKVLSGVTERLSDALETSGGTTGGATGVEATGGSSGGPTGGARRSQAASAGGTAIAGTYGLQSGDEEALSEMGLRMEELEDLSPIEQAQQIVDVASDSSALLEEAEIREVNAHYVLWALQHEGELSPAAHIKRWITELVFRTWLTEAGDILRDGARDGADTHVREQEVKSTLEACVTGLELPTDGVSARDFEDAVSRLLTTLSQIFAEEAAA